jgi:hypothetical protein
MSIFCPRRKTHLFLRAILLPCGQALPIKASKLNITSYQKARVFVSLAQLFAVGVVYASCEHVLRERVLRLLVVVGRECRRGRQGDDEGDEEGRAGGDLHLDETQTQPFLTRTRAARGQHKQRPRRPSLLL